MSSNNSFGGRLKKVLASMCSLFVGASGVSQANPLFKGYVSDFLGAYSKTSNGDTERLKKLASEFRKNRMTFRGVTCTEDSFRIGHVDHSIDKNGQKVDRILCIEVDARGARPTVKFSLIACDTTDRVVTSFYMDPCDFLKVIDSYEKKEFKKFISDNSVAIGNIKGISDSDRQSFLWMYYRCGKGGGLETRGRLFVDFFCYMFGLDGKFKDPKKLIDSMFELCPKGEEGEAFGPNCVNTTVNCNGEKYSMCCPEAALFKEAFARKWKDIGTKDDEYDKLSGKINSIEKALGLNKGEDILAKIDEMSNDIKTYEAKLSDAEEKANRLKVLESEAKVLRSKLDSKSGLNENEKSKLVADLNAKNEEIAKLNELLAGKNVIGKELNDLKVAREKAEGILKTYGGKDDSFDKKLSALLNERNDLAASLKAKKGGYSLNQVLLSGAGGIGLAGVLGVAGYKAGLFGSSKSKKNSTNRANSTPNNKTTKNPRHEVKSPKKPVKRNKNVGGIKT